MMKIEVNTTTATLIPPRESLTPGAVNAVQLEFTFSEEWNGLTKTCVFSNEIETVPAELQNDITSVPTEVLDEVYRWISVGVSGEDAEGTVIIPTIWCRIGQCIPGASGRFVTIDMLQAYWSKQEIDLHTEGDGSKFLGDDGVYHYVSQGGGDVTHEELDAALALKADKDAFDALSATVDDKADKSEIITVTTGDGTKYLADDGTYKTIQGGGDVTHEELDAAIAPLATKDEVSAAVEPLATKTELASATAGLATTAAMNAALALKADKSELASYAKQYDVNQALATKADKTETQTALAQKADKSEIITVTTGSGTLFLADDGTYKPAAGDPPDLSAYLTKTEAGATYATKTELADKADASALADYETTAHAEATYATKAELPDVSDMLTKTEAASTYATQTELADKADKSEIITVTTGTGTLFLADDGTYKPAAGDPPDLSAYLKKDEAAATYSTQTALTDGLATKADKTELGNYETSEHAAATYATKAEIPDVTGFETTAHAEATYATKTELADKADTATVDSALALKADKTELADYETSEHAAATYAAKTELTEGLAGKVDTADIADMLTKTEAESTYADKVSLLTLENTVDAQNTRINNLDTNKADKTQIITVTSGTGTLFLADDGTYKPAAGDPPDLSAYLTKTEAGTTYTTITHAEATYATKEDVTIADNELQEAIDLKADASALADYETTAHAEATYATKAELPDVSDMLTKTEAGTTYATKSELADKADSATVTALSGVVTGHTASISALETGKADKSELPDVSDMLTKTEAGTTYATKTELDAKADRTQLQGYLTKMEASETYETIARASKIKSITAAGHAVTVTDEGLANVGGTKVSRTTEVPQIGVSNVSVSVQQILPATEESTTGEGGTLPISYTSTTSGALTQYSNFTIDGVPIVTKDDIPDVSQFETSAHAAATYQTIADASPIKSITDGDIALTPDANGNVTIGRTIVNIASHSTTPPSKTLSVVEQAPEGAATGNGAALYISPTYENDEISSVSLGIKEAGATTTDFVRLATYGELLDRTSPIKSITAGGEAVAPDANGNVALTKSVVSYNENSQSFAFQGYVGQEDTSGNATTLHYSYDNDGTKSTNLRFDVSVRQSGGTPSLHGRVRAVTYDEFVDETKTFTHTYTGDAQDNWTVTDVWSGSNGELQKITWKEYAATAGSAGELIYTGTDSATSQKRSVRIATFAELGDLTSGFATMQWVQDYIASLDGTNMSL